MYVRLQITNDRFQMTDYRLQITNLKLLICNLSFEICNPPFEICNPQSTQTSREPVEDPPLPLGFDAIAWLVGRWGIWPLVLARVLGLCWTAPGIATPGLDGRSRILLAGFLTALIAPVIGRDLMVPTSPWALAAWCLFELAIGAGLGWSASLVIAGARQAGEIVGVQAGLSPAALFDPELGDGLTPLGHLYGLMALGVFLVLEGPTQLVTALAESYRVIPPGGSSPSPEVATWAFGQVGLALQLALRIAAPPTMALTLAGLALGLLGRTAPSLQLVSLSLPVRTILGLALATLGLLTLAATLGQAWLSVLSGGWLGTV
jgi:flagellar biosynthetic protein FliR